MKFKVLIVVFLAALITGCADPLPPEKMAYAGEWQSSEMALLILTDGTVAYKRLKNGGTTSLNSQVKEFLGDDFVVGIGPFTTTFDVTEPPHFNNGQWQMVVDGVRLTKVVQ